MQLSSHMVYASLPEAIGWLLIVAGIVLGADALGFTRMGRYAARLLHGWRSKALPTGVSGRAIKDATPASSINTIGASTEADRLATIASLQDRAANELEAASDAVTQLTAAIARLGLLPVNRAEGAAPPTVVLPQPMAA
jgi:hypothetical protein